MDKALALLNFAQNEINFETLDMYLKAMVAVVNTEEFVNTFHPFNIEKIEEIRKCVLRSYYNGSYADNQLDPIIFLSYSQKGTEGLLRINKGDLNLWEKYKKLLVIHHNARELCDLVSGRSMLVKPIVSENKLIVFKNIIKNELELDVEELDCDYCIDLLCQQLFFWKYICFEKYKIN